MSNVDTVKEMYEAFGRGDVPAIIEKLDENVEWDTEIRLTACRGCSRDAARRMCRGSSSHWRR